MKKYFKQLAGILNLVFVLVFIISPANAKVNIKPYWEWGNSPKKLDWFVNYGWYNVKWDSEHTMMHNLIKQKTGIDLKIMTPATDSNDKINAMIAADDLPDMISGAAGSAPLENLKSSNKVWDLTELIRKYCPKAFSESVIPPSMPRNMADRKDGKWYEYPTGYEAPENLKKNGVKPWSNAIIVARQDFMKKLNINPQTDFKTQDKMIATLKKFKNANITYKGVKVTPLLVGPEGGAWEAFGWMADTFFAIPSEDNKGNLIDTRTHPKKLEAILFGRKLYAEGLIPKENFTFQRKQIEEKLASGTVFAFMGNKSDYQGAMWTAYQQDKNAKYIAAEPVRSKDGKDPAYTYGIGHGWAVTLISKKSKDPATAIRFITWMYSDEGAILQEFGVENKTFTVGKDGKIYLKKELLELREKNYTEYQKKYGFGDFWWFPNDRNAGRYPPPQNESDVYYESLTSLMRKYGHFNELFERLDLPAGSTLATNAQQIDTYWNNQVPKMLLAKSDAEARKIYTETIAKMKKMGLDEIVKYRNQLFQANKKKAGYKFAWPEPHN
ncbi:extracellular solute-binding protein [Caldicellulosiruptoraceae bacterium PP1]